MDSFEIPTLEEDNDEIMVEAEAEEEFMGY